MQHVRGRSAIEVLVEKPEEMRPLGRHRRRSKNLQTDLKEAELVWTGFI
jgi:hypothetical protein